ncbi:MAG: type III pantothenate kinase [Solobacterium sp.]|jgi:type III pantothenate kinase|nr:type III pantothenate kinase [Solobacterium sp.]
MLLAVDVGNTNISMGLLDGKTVKASFRLTTNLQRTSDEFGFVVKDLLTAASLTPEDIEDVVISSVVPKIMYSLTSCMKKYVHKVPLVVGPDIRTGIKVVTDNPHGVGADRIVNTSYAHYTYGRSCIIVDFGTATTFDYVNAQGEFRYTVISPGLGISAAALSGMTAKLPEIEIKKPESVLGTTTITGMQAGVVYGYIGLVEYIIKQMKKELNDPDCYVIATGGLGRVIAPETDEISEYDPDIAYKGIRILYDMNKEGMHNENI